MRGCGGRGRGDPSKRSRETTLGPRTGEMREWEELKRRVVNSGGQYRIQINNLTNHTL